MKILTIGHASYDITFPIEAYPLENTKTRLTNHVDCGGGPACNAAYLLALWNEDVSFQGVAGNDFYGRNILKELTEVHCNTTYFELKEGIDTMLSFIMANTTNGSRTILTAGSSVKENRTATKDNFETYDVILVDGEEEEMSKRILERNKHAISIIDAGSRKPGTLALCPLVTYLVCSLNFAEEETGITYGGIDDHLKEMHRLLTEKYHNIVVITLEAKGCFTKIGDDYYRIPSITLKAVDTTGAGDIFHGAFTYFISHGYSLEKTCRLANIAGALSITKIGGRFSMPRLEEVLEREADDLI